MARVTRLVAYILFFNFFILVKSYACEIIQVGSGGGDRLIYSYAMGANCTDQEIFDYLKKLPNDEKRNNYVNFVQSIMKDHFGSSQTFANLADVLSSILPGVLSTTSALPQISTSMVSFSADKQTGNYSPEQFEQEFGVPFNKENLGKYIQAGALGSLANSVGILPTTSAEISQAVIAGYSVANFIQSGTLQNIVTSMGNTFAIGFHTLAFGAHEPDYLAEATIRAEQNAINKLYDNYRKALVNWEYQLGFNAYNLSVLSDISWHTISDNVEKSSEQINAFMQQMQLEKDKFDATIDKVTSIAKTTEADLHKSEGEIEELRKGLMSEKSVQSIKEKLSAQLSSASVHSPFNGLAELSGEMQFAYSTTNPLLASQIKNLLKDFVDDNGILTALSVHEKQLQGYQFGTDLNTPDNSNAELIRDAVNEALALKYFAEDKKSYAKADIALTLALSADKAFAKGDTKWANRYLESSLEISSYAGHDGNYDSLTKLKITDAAKADYGINPSADTFQNYKLIELANKFAGNQNIQGNPYLKLYANSLVQQANLDANKPTLNSFMNSIHNGFLLLDSVANGVGAGVTQFVTDSVTGISQLVTHPVDSVEALYNALVHYDRTWELVKNNLYSVIQDFPNYTAEQKAKFITKTSLDIVSLLVPAGEVANIANKVGEFAKLSESLNAVTNNFVNFANYGIQGLEKAEKIAPGYLKYLQESQSNVFSSLELGMNLSSAKPEFISGLMNYSKINSLEVREMAAISRFKDGGSVFIGKNEFEKYVLNNPSEYLGILDGNDFKLFVANPAAANEVEFIAGKSEWKFEEFIGKTHGSYKNGLYRYDVPFSFDYHPSLPNMNMPGANEFFIPGGYTSGGMPEIIFNNVPKKDIINSRQIILDDMRFFTNILLRNLIEYEYL